MEDREVGELWRSTHNKYAVSDAPEWWVTQVHDLIGKLVEESGASDFRGTEEERTQRALARFGIDPEEWEKARKG